MNEFRAGVTASLRSWSALRTAVDQAFGGSDSQQKAEDLRLNIYEHFDGTSIPPKSMVDVTDLEDSLAIFMEEEFSLTLEDGSEKQVADTIWRLYNTCASGDFSLVYQVIAVAEQASVTFKPTTQIQAPKEEEDCDDEDEEEGGGIDYDNEADMMETTTENDTSTALALVNTTKTQSNNITYPPAPISFSSFSSAADYASQPLFGPTRSQKVKRSADPASVRQLGEMEHAVSVPEVDVDGFAPVQRVRRLRKPVS